MTCHESKPCAIEKALDILLAFFPRNHEARPLAAVVIVGPSTRVKCDINSPPVHDVKNTASQIAATLLPVD